MKKKYPLMEIKEFLNATLRMSVCDFENVSICNVTQLQIVKYLLDNKDKDVYQKDFENLLNIRKSTISGILSTMERNNIITRASIKSPKGKIITLTQEALKCESEMKLKLSHVEEELVEGITEEDMETFYRVIDKMMENVKKKGNDKK